MRYLSLAFLITVAACSRPFDRLDKYEAPAELPAFLGDASGLYAVQDSESETIIAVVEVAGQAVVAPAGGAFSGRSNDGGSSDFTILGPLVADPTREGLRGLETDALIPGENNQLSAVHAKLRFGLDAMAISFSAIAPETSAGPCQGTDSCTLTTSKLCDFDSNVAGVFATTVELVSETGDCSAADHIEGTRQWAVTTVNARSEASVVSVSGGATEFALQLVFSRSELALSMDHSLPIEGKTAWSSDSTFSGTVAVSSQTVTLTADVTRASAGCVQTYRASGTRLNGAKIGIACPAASQAATSAALCDNGEPQCPPVAGLYTGERIVSSHFDSREQCTRNQCDLRFNGQLLCDNDSRIAAAGCPSGYDTVATWAPTGTNNYLQNQGGQTGCLVLRCEPNAECESYGRDQVGWCGESDVVTLRFAGRDCVRASCTSSETRCDTRMPPCGLSSLGTGQYVAGRTSDRGCPSYYCRIESPASDFLGAATGMITSPYVIDHFEPPLGSSGQLSKPVVRAPVSGEQACPPVKIETMALSCPPTGWPSNRCYAPNNDTVYSPLVLYPSFSGLCLGVYNSTHNLTVSGFQQGFTPMCGSGTQACCTQPIDFDSGYIQLQCKTPANTDTLMLGGHIIGEPLTPTLTDGTDTNCAVTADQTFYCDTYYSSGESYSISIANQPGGGRCAVLGASGSFATPGTDNLSLVVQCGYTVTGYLSASAAYTLTLETPSPFEQITANANSYFAFQRILDDKDVFVVTAPAGCTVSGGSLGEGMGQIQHNNASLSVTCP